MALTLPSATTAVETAPRAPESARRRLAPVERDPWSWLWTGSVALVALVLRLVDIGHPPGKIFDEVYYAKDAYSLLNHGIELNDKGTGPGFVAHPPLGKWCIALGQWIFGNDAVGWRVPAAVAGALSVLVLARLARRMFRSTLLGCVAGLLLALDGLHFVMSRVALLDVYLMLFLLLAFACLVLDRDARRAAWLRALDAGADLTRGTPPLSWATVPWWRLAAAVCLGLALGVKWSALYYLPVFLLLMVVWDVRGRRSAGVRRPVANTVDREMPWALGFVVLVVVAYLATWTGWFANDDGWDRNWAATTGNQVWWLPDALLNLWHYHTVVYDFHTHLSTAHSYQSTPWSWLVLGRPVAFYYSSDPVCGAAKCSAEVIALGNPLLWWSFLPALVGTAWRWLARRDWAAGAILLGVAAGIVPWMFYPNRTMFFFYALPMLPFLVLAVTLMLGMVLGRADTSRDRRMVGAIAAGVYVLVIAATFAYFYPVYAGTPIPYNEWHDRMWFDSWI